MSRFYYKRGDTETPIRARLEKGGEPYPLEGKKVYFILRKGRFVYKEQAEILDLPEDDDGTSDNVQFQFPEGSTATLLGAHKLEWEVRYADESRPDTIPRDGWDIIEFLEDLG